MRPTHPSPKPKFRSTHPPATTQTHTQINPSIHHQQKLKSPLATTTTSQNNHNRHHNNQPHYQPQNPQPINTNKPISITHHLQFTSKKTYPQTPHMPLHFHMPPQLCHSFLVHELLCNNLGTKSKRGAESLRV